MLDATVIIDYQNVHLIGLNLFQPPKERHRHYLDPTRFATRLIDKRNATQEREDLAAFLTKILVFRGLPSPIYDSRSYARNLNQASFWQRNEMVKVMHRPLKYSFQEDLNGRFKLNSEGERIIKSKREKGIDVLCALALVREARTSSVVILASQDSDLVPAFDEALSLNTARIETFSWYSKGNRRSLELRPESQAIWNTRLEENDFLECIDVRTYK